VTDLALTPREEYLLCLLGAWLEEHGEAPTRADIAEVMGITPGRATQLVAALESKGTIAREARQSRGLALTARGRRLSGALR
jgi:Mn-dependent DtxR family transcriptional regulator